MIIRFVRSLLFGLILTVPSAYAHHAWSAVFTEETMAIEGVVTEYNFKNPHVNIMLSVTDENGVETEWMATGPAAPPMRRWGWSANTVEVGQYLQLTGRKSRTGAPMIVMVADDIQSGKFLELDPVDGSILRVIQETPNDLQSPDPSISVPLNLSDGRPNLSGMWLGGLGRGGRTTPPFNETGATLQAQFDALNDPAFAECADHGLVRQALSGHPLRITQNDDHVIFEYEQGAARRVIYLDGRGPKTAEHTLFGHHMARYEDDALVIESSQLLGRLTVPQGNRLSDRSTVVETYRRGDTPDLGAVLAMSLVVTDPDHLSRPWEQSSRKNFAAIDYEFIEVNCQLPLPAR